MRLPALRALSLAATLVLAGGCVYKVDIQQGNFIDDKAVAQVEAGMTRSQVRFLLGTPMVADSFAQDRWDYVYYLKPGRGGTVTGRHVIVWFEGDTVRRVERADGSAPPPAATPAPPSAG